MSELTILPEDGELPPLAQLPRLFRIAAIHGYDTASGWHGVVDLIHRPVRLRVGIDLRRADLRLVPGQLVSVRWLAQTRCLRGEIAVARLVVLARPEPTTDLFATVPHDWVADDALLARASHLWCGLPVGFRALMTTLMWDHARFRRYCCGPSSLIGHHHERGGNLRHAVDVAETLAQLCAGRTHLHPGLAVLAGLLHDAGKADEYQLASTRRLTLSDRGRLLGHRITVVEWLAVARSQLPPDTLSEAEYLSLLHCLTALPNQPEWTGIRAPASLEAQLVSLCDRFSGSDDLFARLHAPQGGFGRAHRHLRQPPWTLPVNPMPGLGLPATSTDGRAD